MVDDNGRDDSVDKDTGVGGVATDGRVVEADEMERMRNNMAILQVTIVMVGIGVGASTRALVVVSRSLLAGTAAATSADGMGKTGFIIA